MSISISNYNVSNYQSAMKVDIDDTSSLENRKTKFMAINEAAEQESRVRAYKREEAQKITQDGQAAHESVSAKIAQKNAQMQKDFSAKKATQMYQEVQNQAKIAEESKAHQKYTENAKEYTKGSLISQYA